MDATQQMARQHMNLITTFDPSVLIGWKLLLPQGTFNRYNREVVLNRGQLQTMVDNYKNGIPGFRVPVKLTHEDWTGKVGDVVDMRLGADGLEVLIEWTQKGQQLLTDRAFQYLSAEYWLNVTWDGQEVGPVIDGVALLNDPFFEQTALFSAREGVPPHTCGVPNGSPMTHKEEAPLDENTLGKAIAEGFREVFGKADKSDPAPEPTVDRMQVNVEDTEEFQALKAKLAALEAERQAEQAVAAHQQRVEQFSADLGERLAPVEALPEALATIAEDHPDEAAVIVREFKALAAQVDEVALFGELGTTGGADDTADDVARFEALVEAELKKPGVGDRVEAIRSVAARHRDLYSAYRSAVAVKKE